MTMESVNGLQNFAAVSQVKGDNKQLYRIRHNNLERTPGEDTFVSSASQTDKPAVSEYMSYRDIEKLRESIEYSRPSGMLRNYTMDSLNENSQFEEELSLKVSNKLTGRKIEGKIYDQSADLNIKSSAMNTRKGSVKGKIGDCEVNLKFVESDDHKGIKLEGKIDDVNYLPIISLLVNDNIDASEPFV